MESNQKGLSSFFITRVFCVFGSTFPHMHPTTGLLVTLEDSPTLVLVVP